MTDSDVTEAMISAAREAVETFILDTRNDGTEFRLSSAPDDSWIHAAIMEAHADFLPEDWRYDFIYGAFSAIADAEIGADLTEVGDEFSEPDVYTSNLLRWLSSNLNRASYCDEAVEELCAGIVIGSVDAPTLHAQIGYGQMYEKREVYIYIRSAVEKRAQEVIDRLEELGAIIKMQGYDESGLARLTLEEREEWISLGGSENDLVREVQA